MLSLLLLRSLLPGVLVLALGMPPEALAARRQPARLRLASVSPHWTRSFRVRAGGTGTTERGGLSASGVSALAQHRNSGERIWLSPLGLPVNLDFFDEHQASAWRQRYEDSDRNLRLQQRWGLTGVDYQRARLEASSSMGNDMFGQMQGQQISDVQTRAFRAYKRDPNLQTAARVIAPAALVYSLSSGQPFSVRLADSMTMFVRTELGFVDNHFRFKTGTFGLHSSVLNGSFDFRPLLADTRDPGIPLAGAAVAANAAMGAGGSVDFSQERYQLTVSRALPILGLQSSVLYGSSSNAVMGSVSKQLFPHVSMAVDSTRWLSASDPSRASEEKVRLSYGISF